MQDKKVWILWGILFFVLWWNPIFYFAFLIFIIKSILDKGKVSQTNIQSTVTPPLKCSKCGNVITGNHKFCNVCGEVVTPKQTSLMLKCAKCNSVITANHKFCETCGTAIVGDNIKVEMDPNGKVVTPVPIVKKYVKSHDFDSMFSLSEESMIYEFLNRIAL